VFEVIINLANKIECMLVIPNTNYEWLLSAYKAIIGTNTNYCLIFVLGSTNFSLHACKNHCQ